MLTGSFASSYHGAPRATQDVDLVIAPTADQIRAFVASVMGDEFYVDEGAALEALRMEGQFNLIDKRTGWKVDLIIRKSRPFSREEFDRRRVVEIEGADVPVSSGKSIPVNQRQRAYASMNRPTRAASTSPPHRPSVLNADPTMKPSALAKKRGRFCAVTPDPR